MATKRFLVAVKDSAKLSKSGNGNIDTTRFVSNNPFGPLAAAPAHTVILHAVETTEEHARELELEEARLQAAKLAQPAQDDGEPPAGEPEA